ncbi:MAG: hypothetical protein AB2L20_25525 [Mangrovibacterium sp.]
MRAEIYYKKYEYLVFWLLSFLHGVNEIFGKDYKNEHGWFVLAISFLFLSSFFKTVNIRQKKIFVFLSYVVAACFFMVWIFKSYV